MGGDEPTNVMLALQCSFRGALACVWLWLCVCVCVACVVCCVCALCVLRVLCDAQQQLQQSDNCTWNSTALFAWFNARAQWSLRT